MPAEHPLRPIRDMVDTAVRELSGEFARLYPKTGCPSIPPEKLLRALLLQLLYSIRSERQLMEPVDDNLLFRWFVGESGGRWHGRRDRISKSRRRSGMAPPERRPACTSES